MKYIGIILYYLLWPFVWFYAPLRLRVRAVVLVGDEVLVVKNWFGPGRWQLPGGGKRAAETPGQAARRELREELALSTDKSFRLLTTEPITIHQYGILYRYHYVVLKLDEKPTLRPNHEIVAYTWQHVSDSPLPRSLRGKLLTRG